jgi:hypothetical protein
MSKTELYLENRKVMVQGRLCKVAHVDGEGYLFLEDPEAAIATLRRSPAKPDLFTFTRKLPETKPEYSFPFEWDNLAVLSVSTFDHWWKKQVNDKTRNMVRRAEKKGAVIREVPFDDDLVRGIWEIYNETPIRQGRLFPHYGKDISVIRRVSETFLDNSIFIGAFLENKLIGFVKLTLDNRRSQAGVMHIIGMIQHRDKAPTNALIAESVKACASRNISHLVYANFAYGKKAKSSLSDFKERNAFQRVDMPRYYVPLTPWGSVAFRLGLHRRLSEHMPESLAAKLRELRTRWYQRRFNLNAEAV